MKKLVFNRICLISRSEKKAKWQEFSPYLNIVIGENDVGKSSLLKSLYWTLGAEPSRINPSWSSIAISSVLDFSFEEEEYYLFRSGNLFGLFDKDKQLIQKFTSITKELSPFFSKFFSFHLTLASRQGTAEIAPPAYCFLPFYVDQDSSWERSWAGFAKLGQYQNYKPAVASFHSAIRPKEYFMKRAALEEITPKISKLNAEREIWVHAKKEVISETGAPPLALDFDGYQNEVDILLDELQRIENIQENYRLRIAHYSNETLNFRQQISLARKMLAHLEADVSQVRNLGGEVICPTCDTVFENSFLSNFHILRDAATCRNFIAEAQEAILSNEKQEQALRGVHLQHEGELVNIKLSLEASRNGVKLVDVIEAAGRNHFRSLADKHLSQINEDIGSLEANKGELRAEIKELEDSERRNKILTFYRSKMASYLPQLNLSGVDESQYKKIEGSIKETGSDLPRALLAYYLAFYQTAWNFSTTTVGPLVIDSPKQQEPDEENSKKIISLIVSERPSGAQLIIGTTALHGVKAEGRHIELKEERSLLSASEYVMCLEYVNDFFDKIVSP